MEQRKIKVGEYREMVQAFARHLNVNYHACVNQLERELWAAHAAYHFTSIQEVTCCKPELVMKAESLCDKSAELCISIRQSGLLGKV